jgi:hypothetical protein
MSKTLMQLFTRVRGFEYRTVFSISPLQIGLYVGALILHKYSVWDSIKMT